MMLLVTASEASIAQVENRYAKRCDRIVELRRVVSV
jgi:hypothetical protein